MPLDRFSNIENAREDIIMTDKIILHTPLAISLFHGSSENKQRIGVRQYAHLISKICEASKADDPYADWYLLKSYNEMNKAKIFFKSIEQQCQAKLKTVRGVELNLVSNPTSVPLIFRTSFAFMAAYLLADLDYVTRQLMTLRKKGLYLDEPVTFDALTKQFRSFISVAMGWKETGITRKDIKEKSENFLKLENDLKNFGDLPDEVMNKEIKFEFLPNYKLKK